MAITLTLTLTLTLTVTVTVTVTMTVTVTLAFNLQNCPTQRVLRDLCMLLSCPPRMLSYGFRVQHTIQCKAEYAEILRKEKEKDRAWRKEVRARAWVHHRVWVHDRVWEGVRVPVPIVLALRKLWEGIGI